MTLSGRTPGEEAAAKDTARILLDISAEDSTFVDKRIVTNSQVSTVPEKTVRRAETQFYIKLGTTGATTTAAVAVETARKIRTASSRFSCRRA